MAPLVQSDSQSATKDNFHELRHGKTFKRTARRHGRKQARRQMIAIALKNKRKAASKKKTARKKG